MRARSRRKIRGLKSLKTIPTVVVLSVIATLFSTIYTLCVDHTLNSELLPYLLTLTFFVSFSFTYGCYILGVIYEHEKIVNSLISRKFRSKKKQFLIDALAIMYGVLIYTVDIFIMTIMCILKSEGLVLYCAPFFALISIYYMGYIENLLEKERKRK